MNYYAVISTREKPTRDDKTLWELGKYFKQGDIYPVLKVGYSSIFDAYSDAVKEIDPGPEDIIIFCHDDIEIITNPVNFKEILLKELYKPEVGFVGVAGTTLLDKDAVWWEMKRRKAGMHRGFVFQGKDKKSMAPNWFGLFHENVVVLDGCFFATTGYIVKNIINTQKPKEFEGDWDFYDLYYTMQAYEAGFMNRVVPIIIRHESNGDLVGRESWHKNRVAFIKKYRLPVSCQ